MEYTKLKFIDEVFHTKLRVGTDCSGIEAPIQALRQLGIPFKHVFSSDIDKYCIQSIKANYEPEILFGDPNGPYPNGDITQRDVNLLPDIDLYVCGFPCQPFSQAGLRKGFDDKRGNVFWSCLEVIEKKQPKYFILENVKGLLHHDKGSTWKVIWEALGGLEKYGYRIQWKVLNTKDYGIPQNRERIFMVGTKGVFFDWPKKTEMDDIKNYVDWDDDNICTTSERHEKICKNVSKNCVFIDFAYGCAINRKFIYANKYCSCLSTQNRQWCLPKHRYMNIYECLALQGFPIEFKYTSISSVQAKKQIGNSMSVNVLKSLLLQILA